MLLVSLNNTTSFNYSNRTYTSAMIQKDIVEHDWLNYLRPLECLGVDTNTVDLQPVINHLTMEHNTPIEQSFIHFM